MLPSSISFFHRCIVRKAIFVIDESKAVLGKLEQISTGMEKTIKNLSKVQSVIDLLTSVLNFGTAVIAKDIPGINKSFDSLVSKWAELKSVKSIRKKSSTKTARPIKKKKD